MAAIFRCRSEVCGRLRRWKRKRGERYHFRQTFHDERSRNPGRKCPDFTGDLSGCCGRPRQPGSDDQSDQFRDCVGDWAGFPWLLGLPGPAASTAYRSVEIEAFHGEPAEQTPQGRVYPRHSCKP